jgi:hypothetical protein
MKATTFICALIGLAVAATSSAFAADPRGSTPSRPNRVTAVPPPPPPPGGPDKYTAQPRPPGPDSGAPRRPTPVDDFAPDPNTQPSTCYNTDITFGNCAASLLARCVPGHVFGCAKDGSSCWCSNPHN